MPCPTPTRPLASIRTLQLQISRRHTMAWRRSIIRIQIKTPAPKRSSALHNLHTKFSQMQRRRRPSTHMALQHSIKMEDSTQEQVRADLVEIHSAEETRSVEDSADLEASVVVHRVQ